MKKNKLVKLDTSRYYDYAEITEFGVRILLESDNPDGDQIYLNGATLKFLYDAFVEHNTKAG